MELPDLPTNPPCDPYYERERELAMIECEENGEEWDEKEWARSYQPPRPPWGRSWSYLD